MQTERCADCGAELIGAGALRRHASGRCELEQSSQPAQPAPALRPLLAQLDLNGDAHELAPETERLRLFEPAPAQLEGQAWLELEAER